MAIRGKLLSTTIERILENPRQYCSKDEGDVKIAPSIKFPCVLVDVQPLLGKGGGHIIKVYCSTLAHIIIPYASQGEGLAHREVCRDVQAGGGGRTVPTPQGENDCFVFLLVLPRTLWANKSRLWDTYRG